LIDLQSSVVKRVLEEQAKRQGLIAAICAGPTALKSHNIAKGAKITSHPSVKEQLCDGEILREIFEPTAGTDLFFAGL
jgi:putative intracellular protease/amidase